MERKEHFRENWLIFLWVWGEAELILGICGTRQNTIRELRIFFQGFRKINAREHRPPGEGLNNRSYNHEKIPNESKLTYAKDSSQIMPIQLH